MAITKAPSSPPRLVCLGLVLLVLAVYGSLVFSGFVYFDDHVYVTERAEVLAGLTPASIRWALTATDAGFWHPLTWISLMIDHELWGLHPGGYHATNISLHLAATLLLFFSLYRMTGAVWASGFVAVLFAVHPLHVEPVAWIAGRKDVLCAVFWMLSLLLYARYAAKPGPGRYGQVLAAFALGLAAKPMAVTLPAILLLLDIWPLRRLSLATWKRVVAEKVPFALLGLAAGLITISAEGQVGALKTFAEFSLPSRLTNAVVGYGFYLYKTVWPFGLCVHYPHPGNWPTATVALALFGVGAITALAVRRFKAEPYWLVGWLWYAIGLLPVIGLIQIGSHAFADRYSYLPLIGIFMALTWGVKEYAEKKEWRWAAVLIATGITVFLSVVSVRQVQYWQNAETLFRRAVAVTQKNSLALNNLGAALSRQGRYAEALPWFESALAVKPDYAEALFNKGLSLSGQGRYAEAVPVYRKLLAQRPRFAEAHNNIAIAYAQAGDLPQALAHFREAARLRPSYAEALRNLRVAEGQANGAVSSSSNKEGQRKTKQGQSAK